MGLMDVLNECRTAATRSAEALAPAAVAEAWSPLTCGTCLLAYKSIEKLHRPSPSAAPAAPGAPVRSRLQFRRPWRLLKGGLGRRAPAELRGASQRRPRRICSKAIPAVWSGRRRQDLGRHGPNKAIFRRSGQSLGADQHQHADGDSGLSRQDFC